VYCTVWFITYSPRCFIAITKLTARGLKRARGNVGCILARKTVGNFLVFCQNFECSNSKNSTRK
jgi:hypothetical protein